MYKGAARQQQHRCYQCTAFSTWRAAFAPFHRCPSGDDLVRHALSALISIVVEGMLAAGIEIMDATAALSGLLFRERPEIIHQVPDFACFGAIFSWHFPLPVFDDVEKFSIRPVFQGAWIGEVHHGQAHV